jgi:hypothetical protein
MTDRPNTAIRFLVQGRTTSWVRLSLLACLSLAVAIGPGALAQDKPPAPPSWYSKPKMDPQYLIARASATSKEKQLAIDKALHDARVDLGKIVQTRLDSVRRASDREISLDLEGTERYQKLGEKIAVDLKGSRVRNQKASKKGKTWTAFVVMEIPVGATSDALVREVKDDATLLPTLGPSQAFRALEAEASAYQKRVTSSKKK